MAPEFPAKPQRVGRLGKSGPGAHHEPMRQQNKSDPDQVDATAGRRAKTLPVSCGTLVVNPAGQLLLCHVTETAKWDIPKGMQDPGESTLQAAMRELREEAGIVFDAARFEDLGGFAYRRDKRLQLYRVRVQDELGQLEQLVCTSFFAHPVSGRPTPETDGFRWAERAELGTLCWPRMGQLLTALAWDP
jgi:putative (di)nucleoside polyphosphate hydrolase